MLQEVIELQNQAVTVLISKVEAQRETTFRAPTGSGKTYMMADLMNRILGDKNDVIFLVSTLSKGGLAEQNYDKFLEYSAKGDFKNLQPYLINTQISSEERLFIPEDYNVYVLPRDLYKEGGLLMQGAMTDFLQKITANIFGQGLNKKIYVIKDECHQATNNLDSLSQSFFEKIINFSATPNLKRGQNPDVQITDEAAVNANLIKRIELGNETDTVEDAIKKFEEIKVDYRNLLGVNPCLIIQISNKDKAEEELSNTILPILDKEEHQDLKWMIIVDAEKSNKKGKKDAGQRRTNDSVGKKLPLKRWKEYAKRNTSTIDIIIFKMVISEGWDIPRACMLYQIRDTKSTQLDEQVMGRVRRNPRLLDFEDLSDEAKKLATTAWIWGIVPDSLRKTYEVRLVGKDTTRKEVAIRTTRLKPLTQRRGFKVSEYLQNAEPIVNHSNIFDLHRKLKGEDDLSRLCYSYAKNAAQWQLFMEHFDSIKRNYEQYICDYNSSMEVVKDDDGNEITTSFPLTSLYTDNENYLRIANWVWRRKGGHERFSFDSEAEQEWAEVLKDVASDASKKLTIEQKDPELFEEATESTKILLWGKNYPYGSEIKFEYYLNGTHSSYPDFVLKDKKDRIHLFEVKSLNVKKGADINTEEYKAKVLALKNCYKHCSILTGQIFYLPIRDGETWKITRFLNGVEDTLTERQFESFIIDD